ncbi:LAGLIDADG family homing endonuclease [Halorubrum tebenquichense]|uniref:Homing endonuclease LAGLIDADG domain-containing protein n=1 Tax=Halorubrum tebenquichense DSM 14210 TaxID=1227485 RepID=M0DS78_9EURY|nr:LAGLIDADG family homing endonuclease [Halorubrum tebenquichense]ELZ37507.1 hypothetical protein C472_08624 [Halorubrum tebenquichense DSM 14210]
MQSPTNYREIDLAYTMGLIAGESSFFITFSRDHRYAHDVYFCPKFSISMGQKEEEMLRNQCRLYGLGTVNPTVKGFSWVISSREECRELIELIDQYLEKNPSTEFLTAAKHDAYENWRSALEMLRPGRQLNADEVVKLAELREEINYLEAENTIPTEEIKEIVRAAESA